MNDNHRRAVTSILRYVEMQLIDQKIKITNKEVRELHRVRDDLTSCERSKNLLLIESLLKEIRKTKEEFGLEDDKTSLRREVGAALIGVEVVLDGLRLKNLVNYGEIDKDDETQLNLAYMNFYNIFEEARTRSI